jgi:hypothetical protein
LREYRACAFGIIVRIQDPGAPCTSGELYHSRSDAPQQRYSVGDAIAYTAGRCDLTIPLTAGAANMLLPGAAADTRASAASVARGSVGLGASASTALGGSSNAAASAAHDSAAVMQPATLAYLRHSMEVGGRIAAITLQLRWGFSLRHLRRFHSGCVTRAEVDARIAEEAAAGRVCTDAEARQKLAAENAELMNSRLIAEFLTVLELVQGVRSTPPTRGAAAAALGLSPSEVRHAARGTPGPSVGGTAGGASRWYDERLPALAGGWRAAAARLTGERERRAEARATAATEAASDELDEAESDASAESGDVYSSAARNPDCSNAEGEAGDDAPPVQPPPARARLVRGGHLR